VDVSLFDKLKLEELNKVINDLSFNKHQTNRNEVAHFCEHDGIFIRFTRARATWHALAPCALKPWWLSLKPIRKKSENDSHNKITTKNTAENAGIIEEIENA
jgi:hypothetical protein